MSGSALAKGFRPFFFLAGLFAVVVVPLWLAMLSGLLPPPTYLGAFGWHAHEMIFGYSTAVIAGFLLAAVSNWTKRETLVGMPLLLLALLWVLGRLAVSLADSLPRAVPAIVDLAFWPALAAALARPLVAAKNTRNYGMIAVILGLGAVNATMHLDALGVAWFEGWRRRGALVGVDVVVVLILVMAGRVFPMFTRNATGVASIRSLPRLDRASIAAMIAVALADVAGGASSSVALPFAGLAILAAVLAAARAVTWGARHSGREPLLWVLHVGYAWIPLGLVLRAASVAWSAIPESLGTHALTVGSIATLTIGMMARVTLGHTGRPIAASRTDAVSFAFVVLAAVARVLVPLIFPGPYRIELWIAGALWTLGFVLFLVAHAPQHFAPRVDGKPG